MTLSKPLEPLYTISYLITTINVRKFVIFITYNFPIKPLRTKGGIW